jgi:hypothetical protein
MKANRAALAAFAPKRRRTRSPREWRCRQRLALATLLGAKHARAYLQGLADTAVEHVEVSHATVHAWVRALRDAAADLDNPFLRPYLDPARS